MLDTDQLRSFLAIVDCGSFTRAAERVHKTQSAVSMHIRRLEEQLGCALVRQAGTGRAADRRGRAADRIRPPHHPGRGRARWRRCRGRASRRGPARHSGRLRRVLPRRHPRALQSPPPLGRGLGRLRGFDGARRAGRAGALELALVTDHDEIKGLGVWSRNEMARVDFEGSGVVRPFIADGLIGRSPF